MVIGSGRKREKGWESTIVGKSSFRIWRKY